MYLSSDKNIDAAALCEMQASGPVRLVDVRTDAEVAQGIIEGAVHLPLHLLPIKREELHDGVPTVFYCRSGARSGQACAFFAANGYANVYNLEGGIIAWMRAGMSVRAPV
jgi:rhodanese-related sulfurtransferase